MKIKLLFVFLFTSSLLYSQELIQYKNSNRVTHISINAVNSTYNLSYDDRVEVRSIASNEVIYTFPIEQISGFYGVGNSVADNEGNVWIRDRNALYQFDGVSLNLIDSLNGTSNPNLISIETTAQGKLIAVFSNFIGVYESGNWILSDIYQTNSSQNKNKETYIFWSRGNLSTDMIIYHNNIFSRIETTLSIQFADIDNNNDVYVAGRQNSSIDKYGKIDISAKTFEAFDYPSSMTGSVNNMKIAGNYMYLDTYNNGSRGVYVFDFINLNIASSFGFNNAEGILEIFLVDSQNRLWFRKYNSNTNSISIDRIAFDGSNFNHTSINVPEADGPGKSFHLINDNLYYLTSFELKYVDATTDVLKTEVSYPYKIEAYKELNNEIWLATSNGIIRRNNSVDVFTNEVDSDIPTFINMIAKDNNNNVYVAGFSGISKFDGVEWSTVELPTSIDTQTVYDLLFDESDTMWFVTDKALYDFSSGILTEYIYPSSFPGANSQNFSYDGNNLFLGSQNMLYKYKIEDNSWNQIDFGTYAPQIVNIVSDSNNRTWVASSVAFRASTNAGLFEIQNNTLVKVDNPFIEEATNQERLRYISEDNNGILWLSYNPGISTFDGTNFINHNNYSDIPSSPNLSLFSRKISFINDVPYVPFSFNGLYTFQNGKFDKILDYMQDFRAIPSYSIEINNELWFTHFPYGVISRAQQSTLSLGELSAVEKTATVYPNPVKKDETINFSIDMINADYSIHDVLGRGISKGKISNTNNINISQLNKGIYLLNVTKLAAFHTFKIVVN